LLLEVDQVCLPGARLDRFSASLRVLSGFGKQTKTKNKTKAKTKTKTKTKTNLGKLTRARLPPEMVNRFVAAATHGAIE